MVRFLTSSIILHLAVKLIGKLQDGTVFFKKGHDDGAELFEFKTDDGKYWSHLSWSLIFSLLLCIETID